MYYQNPWQKTSLNVNDDSEGESIEAQIRRLTNNKEPIKNAAPLIYSKREDGVLDAYNIRADKWEAMVAAADMATKEKLAERQGRIDDRKAQEEGFKDAADKKAQIDKAAGDAQAGNNQ